MTKQEIDALFAAHDARLYRMIGGTTPTNPLMSLEAAYLAAGLNADGSEKAKRVLMVINPEYPNEAHFWCPRNVPQFPSNYIVTPGNFIPDGAP